MRFIKNQFDRLLLKNGQFINKQISSNWLLIFSYRKARKHYPKYFQVPKFLSAVLSKNHPWQKYRIGIHSEPIRTIPLHSAICIRANANHSEPIWKTFCISFDEKQFYFRINPGSDWYKPNFQSESIWMNPRSVWFGLILIENSV